MSEAPRDERRLMTDWIQEKSPLVLVLIDGGWVTCGSTSSFLTYNSGANSVVV